MPPVRRSNLLPHIAQLVALVERSDTPEMTLRDAVGLLTNRVPIIVEAHMIRSADHAGAVYPDGRPHLALTSGGDDDGVTGGGAAWLLGDEIGRSGKRWCRSSRPAECLSASSPPSAV